MKPPVLVELGPWLVDPVTLFWVQLATGVYVLIGLVVWFFYARSKWDEQDGRMVQHILVGLLHGVLWPVYVALALFLGWAS